MTRTTNPTTELGFELDHFEWKADDRLEVSGRWFGVRGRRFVRPVLTLRADGRRRRLIALLDHKPWSAAEDELWTAAFAWRGEHAEITNARLEVAPDVILDLPAPGADAAGAMLQPRGKNGRGAKRDDEPERAAPAASPPAAKGASSPSAAAAAAKGASSPPAAAPSASSPGVTAGGKAPASPPAAAAAKSASPPAAPAGGEASASPPSAAAGSLAAPAGGEASASPPAPASSSRADEADAALRAHAASLAADLEAEHAELERANAALTAATERAENAERELAALRDRAAVGSGDIAALRRRMETLERERDDERRAASELLERTRHQAAAELAKSKDRATQELSIVQQVAEASARDLKSAKEQLAASRDHAEAVEHELELYGDVGALRRRAEQAEREAESLRERLERQPAVVAAPRGVRPQPPGTDWAARIAGLIAIVALVILAVAIVKLLV